MQLLYFMWSARLDILLVTPYSLTWHVLVYELICHFCWSGNSWGAQLQKKFRLFAPEKLNILFFENPLTSDIDFIWNKILFVQTHGMIVWHFIWTEHLGGTEQLDLWQCAFGCFGLRTRMWKYWANCYVLLTLLCIRWVDEVEDTVISLNYSVAKRAEFWMVWNICMSAILWWSLRREPSEMVSL